MSEHRAGAEQRDRPGVRCAACGARLEPDQEWCVECGAARTDLRRPPNWRAPLAVVLVVIAVVVIAALIALVSLSNQASH